MRKKTPQEAATEHQTLRIYYDAFAPFYDDFYELIDYEAWAGIIQQQIDELTPAPRRLLDVGCGTGSLMQQLANHPDQICIGMDISRSMLLQARKKLADVDARRIIQNNALALGVQSNTFEVVVGNFSLLNLYSQRSRTQMLAEIHRVLMRGGIFITDFFTIQRYHQLKQEKATSETNATFKIRQSLLPVSDTISQPQSDSSLQDPYVIERILTLKNISVRKRLYFLDPQQIEREFLATEFQIIKIAPLMPDISAPQPSEANRLILIVRKP